MAFSDQIRQAIRDSELSQYRIAKEIDVAQSTLSRFLTGRGGLSFQVLDKLSELIDMNIASNKGR